MTKKNLYEQITLDIRKQIDDRKLPPGGKIPSIAEMRQQYGVSHITALRVYRELSTDQYIFHKPGQGYFARMADNLRHPAIIGSLGAFLRPLREYRNSDNYFNSIWVGIQNECCARHLNLLSSHSTQGLNQWTATGDALDRIKAAAIAAASQVDGYLLDERLPDDIVAEIASKCAKPVVLVNRMTALKDIDAVSPNHRGNLDKMFNLARNYDYNAFIYCSSGMRGCPNVSTDFCEEFHLQAEKRRLENLAIIPDTSIVPLGESTAKFMEAYEKLKKKSTKVLAIVESSAFGREMTDIAVKSRIKLGRELGIINGIDTGYSRSASPEIAALKTVPEQLGRMAVSVLMDRTSYEFMEHKTHFPDPEIIIGETF
jgi:DNA-binding transcriptional regulator YhcF (GntR family)